MWLRSHRAMCNAPAMPTPEELIGSAEACDILRVNRSTLVRWVKVTKRLVPVHKLPKENGAYLFRREDIERLAEERKAGAA